MHLKCVLTANQNLKYHTPNTKKNKNENVFLLRVFGVQCARVRIVHGALAVKLRVI